MEERVWRTRLRWRLRGATMWPAFLAHARRRRRAAPRAADRRRRRAGRVRRRSCSRASPTSSWSRSARRWPAACVRRRRPELPQVVADDRAGTALLGPSPSASLAVGLVHRPAVEARARAFDAAGRGRARLRARPGAVRLPAQRRAPGHVEAGAGPLPHVRPGRRTQARWLCLLVDTTQRPGGRDASTRPRAERAVPEGARAPRRERAALEALADPAEELGGVGAVEDAVVAGERELIMLRTTISPSRTTGARPISPTARIAACGGLMTAMKLRDAVHPEVRDRERPARELGRA